MKLTAWALLICLFTQTLSWAADTTQAVGTTQPETCSIPSIAQMEDLKKFEAAVNKLTHAEKIELLKGLNKSLEEIDSKHGNAKVKSTLAKRRADRLIHLDGLDLSSTFNFLRSSFNVGSLMLLPMAIKIPALQVLYSFAHCFSQTWNSSMLGEPKGPLIGEIVDPSTIESLKNGLMDSYTPLLIMAAIMTAVVWTRIQSHKTSKAAEELDTEARHLRNKINSTICSLELTG